MKEDKVISLKDRSTISYQDFVNLQTDIKEVQINIKHLEKELDNTEDNKIILQELKLMIKELSEWRKASEVKLQVQNDNQIKMTAVLDQLVKDTDANSKQISTIKTNGSVSFNEMLKKAFWLVFVAGVSLLIGILGWAPK